MVVVRMNFFGINKSVDIFTFLGKKILSVSHGKHYPALLEYDTCYLVKLYTINKWGGTKSEVNYSNDFTKLTFLLRIKCPRFFSVTMILVDAYLYVRKVETGTSVRYNDLSCHSNRRNICNLRVRGGQVTFLA